MLKICVPHGYCSRHQAVGACPYANICETCDYFVAGPEHADTLRGQLTDVQHSQRPRGWDSTPPYSVIAEDSAQSWRRIDIRTGRLPTAQWSKLSVVWSAFRNHTPSRSAPRSRSRPR